MLRRRALNPRPRSFACTGCRCVNVNVAAWEAVSAGASDAIPYCADCLVHRAVIGYLGEHTTWATLARPVDNPGCFEVLAALAWPRRRTTAGMLVAP